MMHLLSDLTNFAIKATDGKIGTVADFYFDDRRWVIRYLVVNLGSALGLDNRKVLLSPATIKHINHNEKIIAVDMSLSEIENSPVIDTAHSLSSNYEIDYLSYYGYAFNWDNGSQNSFAVDDETVVHVVDAKAQKSEDVFIDIDSVRRMYGDRHLRSCHEIINYQIQAADGEIGRLKSMLIDDDTWAIQCCIANTGNWWFGHQVLITPQAIRDISWGSTKIYVDMTQQQIKGAPLFDYSLTNDNRYELGVYLHQDRNQAQPSTTPETYN